MHYRLSTIRDPCETELLSKKKTLGKLAIFGAHVNFDEPPLGFGLPHMPLIGRMGLEISQPSRSGADKRSLAWRENVCQSLPRVGGIRVLGNASVRDKIGRDIIQYRHWTIELCCYIDWLIGHIVNPNLERCQWRIEQLGRRIQCDSRQDD